MEADQLIGPAGARNDALRGCVAGATLLVGVLLLWSAACMAAAADDAASHVWTLKELEDALARDNPQLRQARHASVAARLQVPQADALPGPQVSLLEQANTGGHFNFEKNSGFYTYYTVQQSLPWPGKLRLAADVARAQADATDHQYDVLLLQMLSQLRTSVYQFDSLREQLRFMQDDQQRLEELKEVARIRYSNNAAAYVDFLGAQVSASSLENDRFGVERQLQTAGEQINVLIGRGSQQGLQMTLAETLPPLPTQPLAALIDLAQQQNPQVAATDSQLQVARSAVELAHRQRYPDFQVTAGTYSNPPINVDTMRMFFLGVSLSLPTWFMVKEDAAIDQAKAQAEAASDSREATRQQVELAVAAAYHALETSLRQIHFTESRLMPQAQMAYRLALVGYRSRGDVSFSDLMNALGALRGTEVNLLQARRTAVQAYVSLVGAIGTAPP